jgi:hypothetical protein
MKTSPLYEGRKSLEPIRLTNKLISGPLIVKTVGGPGQLLKEADSMDFREQTAAMGVHILLSLPNGASCTAEMDQLFEKFKPACSKSAIRVAGKTTKMRADVRLAERQAQQGADDSNDDESDDKDDGKRKEQRICNVIFSNFDLGHLVNGWPDDTVKLQPFDCHFTPERIIKTWIAVGFLPMTGNVVNDPKVRHELGDGGAPCRH